MCLCTYSTCTVCTIRPSLQDPSNFATHNSPLFFLWWLSYIWIQKALYLTVTQAPYSFLPYLQNFHFRTTTSIPTRRLAYYLILVMGINKPNLLSYSFVAILKADEILEVPFGGLGLTPLRLCRPSWLVYLTT